MAGWSNQEYRRRLNLFLTHRGYPRLRVWNGPWGKADWEAHHEAKRLLGYPTSQVTRTIDRRFMDALLHPSHLLNVKVRPGYVARAAAYWRLVQLKRAAGKVANAGKGHISQRGLDLIARFEGFEPNWYDDGTGTQTIYFGHVGPLPSGFKAGGSRAEGLRLLAHDIVRYEDAVKAVVSRSRLSQGVLDGLTSFVYNLGGGALTDSSQIAARVNRGDLRGAADQMLAYVQPFPAGLRPRREAEVALLLGH